MEEVYQVNERMDEDGFWAIIQDSLTAIQAEDSDDDPQAMQYEFLKYRLIDLTWQEIIAFRNRFDDLYMLSYQGDLWCAAYIMNGGCSDDGFDYFRAWLIAQGKETFYNALNNPDSLADLPQTGDEAEYEFEHMMYVAGEAFKEKYQGDIYAYLANKPLYGDIVFNWDEDDEASMKAICPKLYEKFW